MNEERIWYLMSLSLSGELTPEEAAELNALLQQHPNAALRAAILQNVWKSRPQETTPGTGFDKHLQRLSTHLSAPVLQFDAPAQMNMEQRPVNKYRRRWI